jgi:hypothetical protein
MDDRRVIDWHLLTLLLLLLITFRGYEGAIPPDERIEGFSHIIVVVVI